MALGRGVRDDRGESGMTAKCKRRPIERRTGGRGTGAGEGGRVPQGSSSICRQTGRGGSGQPGDPVQAVAIPALVMDVLTKQRVASTERCVNDCIILAAADA